LNLRISVPLLRGLSGTKRLTAVQNRLCMTGWRRKESTHELNPGPKLVSKFTAIATHGSAILVLSHRVLEHVCRDTNIIYSILIIVVINVTV